MFWTDRHPDDCDLVARLDQELTAARAAAVDAHLARCEPCRRRAESLLAASMSVRIAVRAVPDREHHERARAALVDALQPQVSWTESRRRQVLVPAAAAAIVAALAVVWLYGGPNGPRRDAASPLPIARLTPGAASSLTAAQLCAGQQPSRLVPAAVARVVLRAYAAEDLSPNEYELDALITPELGGTADAENLWPQRYTGGVWTAYVKDEIENHLRDLVCTGQLDLAVAQQDMATNWIAAYQKYFHRDRPSAERPAGTERQLVRAMVPSPLWVKGALRLHLKSS